MPIRIIEGLDIPIKGGPSQEIADEKPAASVALLGRDYIGLRPIMRVEEGDNVKTGQPILEDRKHQGVVLTSPGSGVVKAIHRGPRRSLQSLVVELEGRDEETFNAWPEDQLTALRRDQVIDNLLESGQWAALRARPYGKIPDPRSKPSSIFVTAVDSNPLAPRPEVVIGAHPKEFGDGLTVLSHLTEGPVYLCQAPNLDFPTGDGPKVLPVEFSGPHPAGLVGTHIHFLDPVGQKKSVWHLNYQDVIAIGALFTTGRLFTQRVVALAGPAVRRPRLIRTQLGVSAQDLIKNELHDVDCRVISGSVLSGHQASGPQAYLGRYHHQISVIGEALSPDTRSGSFSENEAFSVYGPESLYGRSAFSRPLERKPSLTTALHGRPSSFVPFGGYERVMPLDVLPTPLLRALLVGDTDMAQALGCLELEEEDLALCTFVCPSKQEYGRMLRTALERVEKEG